AVRSGDLGDPALSRLRAVAAAGARDGARASDSAPQEALADRILDPVGVAAQDLVDRPGDDARHVVAVKRSDPLDQRVAHPVMGLEDRRVLVRCLDLALPAVDRPDRAEDVHARGEPFLDDGPADALGFFGIGEYRVDGNDAHRAFRPSSCAPQTVAATSRAP